MNKTVKLCLHFCCFLNYQKTSLRQFILVIVLWLILCFVTDTFVSNRFNKDVPYLSVIANNVIWCLAS